MKVKQNKKSYKVLTIDDNTVTIEFEDNKTLTLKPRQLPSFVKVGDLVRHREHRFFDVVDNKGNLIFRNTKMNKAYKNIENIQKLVADSVNGLLVNEGYSLINKEKFGNSQALVLQWANKDRQHAFQLIWDIREQWFSLGEFNQTNNLIYTKSNEIDIFPYSVIGVLFRKSYDAKYIKKIKSKIKEKLNTPKPKHIKI